MILQGVVVPAVLSDHTLMRMETRSLVVGLTALIGESADVAACNNGILWSSVVISALKLLSAGNAGGAHDDEPDIDFDVSSMSYDSSYSKLNFASRQVPDPFPSVPADLSERFIAALSTACARKPGALVGALGAACADPTWADPESIKKFGGVNPGALLQELCARYGCQLV